ncbi:hypothetical protein [Brevibacillus sp. SYSU BS000544]|uniref:hypothetical protein n=1 Tax=Brevibacillus sp. SYSU BS000544 TaxID=3416443 RepID=UPI003CE460F2
MYQALSRIMEGAKHGITNTEIEFGSLQSHSPVSIKLDEDPIPLQQEELVLFKGTVFKPEQVGTRLALLRCTNGQYLVLGEVE